MTKPVYNAIIRYSPDNPVIVFVPTRKQAKLTAIDILTLTSSDRKPDRFLRANEEDIRQFVNRINDRVRGNKLVGENWRRRNTNMYVSLKCSSLSRRR